MSPFFCYCCCFSYNKMPLFFCSYCCYHFPTTRCPLSFVLLTYVARERLREYKRKFLFVLCQRSSVYFCLLIFQLFYVYKQFLSKRSGDKGWLLFGNFKIFFRSSRVRLAWLYWLSLIWRKVDKFAFQENTIQICICKPKRGLLVVGRLLRTKHTKSTFSEKGQWRTMVGQKRIKVRIAGSNLIGLSKTSDWPRCRHNRGCKEWATDYGWRSGRICCRDLERPLQLESTLGPFFYCPKLLNWSLILWMLPNT